MQVARWPETGCCGARGWQVVSIPLHEWSLQQDLSAQQQYLCHRLPNRVLALSNAAHRSSKHSWWQHAKDWVMSLWS